MDLQAHDGIQPAHIEPAICVKDNHGNRNSNRLSLSKTTTVADLLPKGTLRGKMEASSGRRCSTEGGSFRRQHSRTGPLCPATLRQTPAGQGPEEILERESTLTARLREAARVETRRGGGSAEKQEWEEGRRFGGTIIVEKKEEALKTAKEWNGPDTVWTDGSRQEDSAVGAACVWRSPDRGRWTGRRFQLGKNKEVFDAEVFAVWQALRALEQRSEHGREYTIFVDSTSAITRVRDDTRGRGQRFGGASIKVETRLAAAGNRVNIRWDPAHAGAEENEVADQYVKDAATGRTPRERLPEGYAEEASLAHMTRVATGARSRATTEWITDHVRPGRRYRPPPGKGVMRTQLRRVKRPSPGDTTSCCQATRRRELTVTTSAGQTRQSAGGVPAESHSRGTISSRGARPGDRRRGGYGRTFGEALGWRRPQTPSVRYLWEKKATGAVLEFLRTTRVGCVVARRVPLEEREEESGE